MLVGWRCVRYLLRGSKPRFWTPLYEFPTICGQAESGRTGVEKFQKLKPDVVLLDLSMPDMTGIEANVCG